MTVGCQLAHRRYDKIVEAMGGHGEYVEKPEDIGPAIQRALDSGLPACVNVMTDPEIGPGLGGL
jgi:acetolactate synthase-1/2/3 large subunit